MVLWCHLIKFCPKHPNVKAENKTAQTKQPYSSLLSSNFGQLMQPVASGFCPWPTGVTLCLVFCCCSPCIMFKGEDALLHTLVLTCGYLSYCWPSITTNQSSHSPLIYRFIKAFLPTQLLLTG